KAYPSADGLSVYFRDVSGRIEAQREIERNAARQQAIISFGRSALSIGRYDDILRDALELVRELLEVNVVEAYDYDREAKAFSVRHAIGWGPGAAFDCRVPVVEHLAHVLRSGEAFACSDVRIEPRARSLKALADSKMLSCLAVLVGTPAAPIGALVAYYPLPRTYTVGDVRFVEAIAQTLAESETAFESMRRMTQILESIQDGFVSIDRDMRVTHVNSQMARAWKLTPAEMIGQPVASFLLQIENGETVLEYFRASLHEDIGTPLENFDRGHWFETRVFRFATGIAAYVRDITHRKAEQQHILELNAELEGRVAERTRQLEAANKELESFSYSVSHDLRAPLRAIDGFAQALVEDYDEQFDDRARGYLHRVRKAAQRMADLIDALLRLAKVARAPMTFVDVDVSAAARVVLGDLLEHEPERHVEVEIEPGMVASGEPSLLLVVLQNLMGNAWKFTRHNDPGRIAVGRNEAGEFFVRDNGAGFDMAYGNKLFGAFQRLHAADEYEGTGIGLATVARIVHRHGGTIRAEGALGEGATFYFLLPAAKDGTHIDE
ncbi:MAG TPA: ATP-binding protein, partial [Candidatus Baltobacteraceae bacterium]|nr:ATP-binding protein [Candidatus Baltobacteraceae bacterium]